jgi:hypothetical protein
VLDPESCRGRKADPAEVGAAYAKLVAQAAGPGIESQATDDKTVNIPMAWCIFASTTWVRIAMNSYALVAATVSQARPVPGDAGDAALIGRDDVINPFVPLRPPG